MILPAVKFRAPQTHRTVRRMLAAIDEEPGSTVSEVAEALGVGPSWVSRLAIVLEAAEVLVRLPGVDRDGTRAWTLHLIRREVPVDAY